MEKQTKPKPAERLEKTKPNLAERFGVLPPEQRYRRLIIEIANDYISREGSPSAFASAIIGCLSMTR